MSIAGTGLPKGGEASKAGGMGCRESRNKEQRRELLQAMEHSRKRAHSPEQTGLLCGEPPLGLEPTVGRSWRRGSISPDVVP